ncbi:acetyl-CoA carboxylase biotin carboxyl carrier protein [Camelliibacillus cellulosilyticus]|uniref:Biotin carboxyl carrier protein of acetyl-CoA carboxylase n=1 Tax=Camelliibacillus cellulosilyticus TaxID=2174486 RepID=A0ABV9GIS6_9BACL
MLKVQEIRELIKLIDESSIHEFKYEYEGSKIVMKKKDEKETVIQTVPALPTQAVTEAPRPAAPAPESKAEASADPVNPQDSATDNNLHKIEAPMVGTFYSSPNPDSDEFVKVGSKVDKNTVVCIVEAMKLFNEIEADVKGEIVEVLVENGQLVEYGQPLFLVKTE